MKRPVLWLLTLLVLAGCAVIPGRLFLQKLETSPHDGDVIFSHKRHADMTIECTACHPEARSSQFVVDSLLPKKAECMQCHRPTQPCQLCHQDVASAVALQPREYPIRFSHQKHEQADCVVCHATMPSSRRVSDTFFPGAGTCRSCHEIREDTCEQCHEDLTQSSFLPLSHDAMWLGRHEAQVADADLMCEQCHRGTLRADAAPPKDHEDVGLCASCHRGDLWPESVHDNNYIQTHSVDAQTATTTCISCHQYEECMSCHESQAFSFVSVHPAGWQFDHADTARRQLMACTTCHVEADCLGCHQTLSPHPEGFDVGDHAGKEQLCRQCHFGKTEDVCRRCHVGGIND